jgi:hypothetical protein
VVDLVAAQTTPGLVGAVVMRNSSSPAGSAGKGDEMGTLDKRHVHSFNKERARMEIIAVSHMT